MGTEGNFLLTAEAVPARCVLARGLRPHPHCPRSCVAGKGGRPSWPAGSGLHVSSLVLSPPALPGSCRLCCWVYSP